MYLDFTYEGTQNCLHGWYWGSFYSSEGVSRGHGSVRGGLSVGDRTKEDVFQSKHTRTWNIFTSVCPT